MGNRGLKPAVIAAIEAGGGNADVARRVGRGCTREYVRLVRHWIGRPPLHAGRADQVDRLVRQYVRAGADDTEIARRAGVDPGTIRRRRRALGLDNAKAAITARHRELVRHMHGHGLSDNEIARRLKVSDTAVGRHRKALGLAPNDHFGSDRARELASASRWGRR